MIHKLTFGIFSKQDVNSFSRLLIYIKPYKLRIIFAIIAIIGVALTESYLAAFIAPLVNEGFAIPHNTAPILTENDIIARLHFYKELFYYTIWGTNNKIWIVPVFFMSLVIVRGICRFVSSYLLTWVSVMAISQLRQDMFNKMLLLPAKQYEKQSSGEMLMNIVQMADSAINNASSIFIVLIRDSLIVVGLICVLLYLNWQLSLIVLLIFPILSFLSRYYRNKLKQVIDNSQQSVGILNHVINEVHQGHKVIKIFGSQNIAQTRFDTINQTIVRLSKKITQAMSARSPISEMIASTALAVVIFIALWQSQKGVTTIGEFMAFIVAMMQMYGPLKNLANISIPMQTMFLASDAVCHFLDSDSEDNTGQATLTNTQGVLTFDNVSVQYGTDSKFALDEFSLHINAGEKIALVGRSGSGKSTLINLLTRFISPVSGKICIDGVDINEIKLNHLRQQFALVSQETFLFEGTLAENIRYSKPNASDDEVLDALDNANLTQLVHKLPNGINEPIGANGSKLSGGQRQRVAIARAILKDAPILLLDEATSALDNESERLVQQALERLMKNRTSIIVAHRLTTIEECDRIIVMDDGKIIEQGSHAQLLAKGGYYAHLNKLPHKPANP